MIGGMQQEFDALAAEPFTAGHDAPPDVFADAVVGGELDRIGILVSGPCRSTWFSDPSLRSPVHPLAATKDATVD